MERIFYYSFSYLIGLHLYFANLGNLILHTTGWELKKNNKLLSISFKYIFKCKAFINNSTHIKGRQGIVKVDILTRNYLKGSILTAKTMHMRSCTSCRYTMEIRQFITPAIYMCIHTCYRLKITSCNTHI